MSFSSDSKKTNSSKKMYLQSQNNKDTQTQNLSLSQLPLSQPPPPPTLQFQRQQQKKLETKREDSAEQQMKKRSLDNTKDNIGNLVENSIIQYFSNTDKLIDYYRQTTDPLRDLSYDNLKLQKDCINAFQSRWIEHMKTNVDNYLIFQNKMIMLYNQMFV